MPELVNIAPLINVALWVQHRIDEQSPLNINSPISKHENKGNSRNSRIQSNPIIFCFRMIKFMMKLSVAPKIRK